MAWVLDRIGSIWFGVTCLFLILVYSWLGSAGLAPFSNARESFIRQRFEKTEMAWFAWWPFGLLLSVFCFALVVITLRRIPFKRLNYGVWLVHSGILTLCTGCWIYFGTKIEGDAVVYRREAVIKAGDGEPVRMVLQPNAEVLVRNGSKLYQIGVSNLNPHYTLLTGDDKGKVAYAASLYIQPFENGEAIDPFVRQLIINYPQYTEDVIPGKGRAVKVTGEHLVDKSLSIDLDFAPVDRFFVKDSPALHVRISGEDEWTEYSLDGLPRYTTHLASVDQVRYHAGERPTVRALDLEPVHNERTPKLDADVSFRVTGYVAYGYVKEFYEPGGELWNPWMKVRFEVPNRPPISRELLAFDPKLCQFELDEGIEARFQWIDDPAELERLLNPDKPELLVKVPGSEYEETFKIRDLTKLIELGETGYTLEFQDFIPNWSLASSGRKGESAAMLLAKLTRDDLAFTRAVIFPDVSLSQDIDVGGQRHAELLDTDIHLELRNVVSPGLTLVAGEVGCYSLLTNRGGEVEYVKGEPGEGLRLLDGALTVTIEDVSKASHRVIKPEIVALREQNPKTLPRLSLIKVDIIEPGGTRSEWVEYSHYAHQNRIGFFPIPVRLRSGKRIEVLYSRETYALPAPMALENFTLQQFPGKTRERDYISMVRFLEDGNWSDPHEVRSNQPTEHKTWWYFQSTWDPPAPQINYKGLNYTGIGVGNRNGVMIMLIGTIMIVLGTLYAFYYKPVLRRRMQAAMKAKTDSRAKGSSPSRKDDEKQLAESVRT